MQLTAIPQSMSLPVQPHCLSFFDWKDMLVDLVKQSTSAAVTAAVTAAITTTPHPFSHAIPPPPPPPPPAIHANTQVNTHVDTLYVNNHKTFNLHLFLNETCKDAMNMTEFVDSIQLQLSDLEHVGQAGYVDGISDIIVSNLKKLDVTQRPVHCTDTKRETVYIKDQDRWERDDTHMKLKSMIHKVSSKNQRMLHTFKERYPDCHRSTSRYSDQYNKIVVESMGGTGDDDDEKKDKIMKRIVREVGIPKETFLRVGSTTPTATTSHLDEWIRME
jgi:hypothetical protein